MSNPKHTNWIFTLNNYSEEDPQRILDTIEDNVKYVLFGKEVAPTTGTPHLQGLIVFRSKVRRRTVQETIKPGVLMHVEIMRSLKGSIVYNRKDGDWFEAGERPVSQEEKGMKEKERYKRAWDLARSGDLDGLIEEHPDIAMRHYSTIKRIRTDAMHKRKLDTLNPEVDFMHWYWGPAGTGKSRKAREENPDAYLKDTNKWWCGYVDQDVVIVEDVDLHSKTWMCRLLKIWTDIYPFNAEVKTSSTGTIRPKKVIVTSNYRMEDIWEDPRELEPIKRRFKVTHFPSLGSVPIHPPAPQENPNGVEESKDQD